MKCRESVPISSMLNLAIKSIEINSLQVTFSADQVVHTH